MDVGAIQGCQYVTLREVTMAWLKQAAELLPSEELAWLGKPLGEALKLLVNYATKPGGVRLFMSAVGPLGNH